MTHLSRFTKSDFLPPEPPAITPSPRSWSDLIKAEPRLVGIERFVRSLPADRGCREWESVKRRFIPLIGWDSKNAQLRSSDCYEICYDYLLAIFEGEQR